jgi:hypothetical protein
MFDAQASLYAPSEKARYAPSEKQYYLMIAQIPDLRILRVTIGGPLGPADLPPEQVTGAAIRSSSETVVPVACVGVK